MKTLIATRPFDRLRANGGWGPRALAFKAGRLPFGQSPLPFKLSPLPFKLSPLPFKLSPHPFGLSLSKPLLLAAACLVLAGCETPYALPKVDVVNSPHRLRPQPVPAPAPNNGAIYQAAQYRPMFEDHRARLVGDTLTVQIVEKVAASQKSTSSLDKTGAIGGGVSALPGVRAGAFARAAVEGSSSNTFEGKGSTENTNDFSGVITSVVTDVLPNGHLIVAGEKQIGVNQNVDVLRFSGQVDPRSIQPGNTVQSVQIANVRIEHRGRGAQADVNGIGWLGRFFLNVMPF